MAAPLDKSESTLAARLDIGCTFLMAVAGFLNGETRFIGDRSACPWLAHTQTAMTVNVEWPEVALLPSRAAQANPFIPSIS
jgi:hypothetical protein